MFVPRLQVSSLGLAMFASTGRPAQAGGFELAWHVDQPDREPLEAGDAAVTRGMCGAEAFPTASAAARDDTTARVSRFEHVSLQAIRRVRK